MIMQSRDILLPNGSLLEVSMKPEFLHRIVNHFGLDGANSITDEHIRMYIFGAFKNALDKVEDGRSDRNSC